MKIQKISICFLFALLFQSSQSMMASALSRAAVQAGKSMSLQVRMIRTKSALPKRSQATVAPAPKQAPVKQSSSFMSSTQDVPSIWGSLQSSFADFATKSKFRVTDQLEKTGMTRQFDKLKIATLAQYRKAQEVSINGLKKIQGNFIENEVSTTAKNVGLKQSSPEVMQAAKTDAAQTASGFLTRNAVTNNTTHVTNNYFAKKTLAEVALEHKEKSTLVAIAAVMGACAGKVVGYLSSLI